MLPSLTTAFLLGLFCGSQLPFFPIVICGVLVGTALVLTWFEQYGDMTPRRAVWLYGALLAGVCYWTIAAPAVHADRSTVDHRKSPPVDIVGRVMTPVQHGPGRQTALVVYHDADSRTRIIRLVWRDPGEALHYGDRIAFRTRLRAPSGSMNPGGFDYAAYVQRQGISYMATVSGEGAVRVTESGAATWRWFAGNRIDHWRATIRSAAVATLSQPALGVFLGIIIGERGYLQQDLQEWFMATGTVHLLSISGSHLGLVAGVVFWIVRRTALMLPPRVLLELSRIITPSRVAILVTWPIVALYAWVAGAELATMRSLIMITLALAGLWLGHARPLYHAVAAAALVIVLHSPSALFDISFQLSFLSVFMLIQTAHRMESVSKEAAQGEQREQSIRRYLVRYSRDALVMSAAVTVATLPIVALYFNQVPWMGVVTNLLAVPYTGALLVPIGLLSAAWTVLSGTDHLAMEAVFQYLTVGLTEALRWCAGIPGAEWHIAAPSLPTMVVFYAVLVVSGIGWISARVRIAGVTAAVLILCWWVASPRVGLDGDQWQVTFLDVGQGDSAVLELPDGKTVLIDGGARYERFDMGRGVVAPFLWNRGITRLDHVVATHQQLDHVGGLIWLLRHIPVARYWENGVERSERFVKELTAALNDGQVPRSIAVRGQEMLEDGPCRLTILNPSAGPESQRAAPRLDGTSLNNESIVSRLQCGAQSMLFAADIEVDGLRRLSEEGRRPVTVLKVPHHGARSSLDHEWIGQIRPRYAVISAGRSNSYGHPTTEVLDAYGEKQAEILRTDRDGAIWVTGRLSSPEITVTRMRDRLVRPVDLRHGVWNCERENWRRMWQQYHDRSA